MFHTQINYTGIFLILLASLIMKLISFLQKLAKKTPQYKTLCIHKDQPNTH